MTFCTFLRYYLRWSQSQCFFTGSLKNAPAPAPVLNVMMIKELDTGSHACFIFKTTCIYVSRKTSPLQYIIVIMKMTTYWKRRKFSWKIHLIKICIWASITFFVQFDHGKKVWTIYNDKEQKLIIVQSIFTMWTVLILLCRSVRKNKQILFFLTVKKKHLCITNYLKFCRWTIIIMK